MYSKIIEYLGYRISICCVPSTTNEELYARAKEQYNFAVKAGLKDFWLREYLKGLYSLEYMLKDQQEYKKS